MRKLLYLPLWIVLAAQGALAAEKAEQSPADLEAKLQAAQQRLEAAAQDVAELSSHVAGRAVRDHMFVFGGPPRRVLLGVQLDDREGGKGAYVREVSPGGPAAEAGVETGDIVVAVNGTDVTGDGASRRVVELMRDVEPLSKVKLRVLRDGQPKELEVTTREVFVAGMAVAPGAPMPPSPRFHMDMEPFELLGGDFPRGVYGELRGMELASLTPGLGRYFGTDEGVLVLRAPQSDAVKLEDGDVILSIDGREPTSGSHATRILRSYQPGEKISLRLMRQRKAMTLEATLPERSRRGSRPEVMLMRGHGDAI